MSFKYFFGAPYQDLAKWDAERTQMFLVGIKVITTADMGSTWDTGIMAPRYHLALYTTGNPGSYFPPLYEVVGESPLRVEFTSHPTAAGGSYYDSAGFEMVAYSFNW